MARIHCFISALFILSLLSSNVSAESKRIRVVNDTNSDIYIHQGGYAPSQKIGPGRWRFFQYPFVLTPPNSNAPQHAYHLAATAGGKWLTTSNGLTYLSKPTLRLCLLQTSIEAHKGNGDLSWTIQHTRAADKNCNITSYKQAWWQPSE